MKNTQGENPPSLPWLNKLLSQGFKPYIITSAHLLETLNTKPFGVEAQVFVMQEPKDKPFLDAYLLGDAISFGSPAYKMERWVYVDCVLMQGAVIGFMAPREKLSKELETSFQEDMKDDFDKLSAFPVSGQIDSQAEDGSFVNIGLFSLGSKLIPKTRLGVFTKALSLEVHNIRNKGCCYRVVCQYDNASLGVHGLLTNQMLIDQIVVPHHPGQDMTLVVKMMVNYDPQSLGEREKEPVPDFWLPATDKETKVMMQEMQKDGSCFELVPPFTVKRAEGVCCPIRKVPSHLQL